MRFVINKKNPEAEGALKVYLDLINNIDKNLKDPILGEDYYNMGCDVLSCNRFLVEDLKSEYIKLRRKNRLYKMLIAVLVLLVYGLAFYIVNVR